MASFSGDKLSEARRQRGQTQEQLAAVSGISVSTIMRYEQSRMTVLGVKVEDFMVAEAAPGRDGGTVDDLPPWAQGQIRRLRSENATLRRRSRGAVPTQHIEPHDVDPHQDGDAAA